MNPSALLAREVVTSRHHPVVQQVRALHTRAERERTGLFLCEGVRFIAHAAQAARIAQQVTQHATRVAQQAARVGQTASQTAKNQDDFGIERLIYAPSLLTHKFGRNLVQQHKARGVPCLPVSPDVFQFLALGDETQGVLGVVRQSWTSLSAVDPQAGLCWVAPDTVRSPGNLGTMLRTGEAVGASGFILLGDGIDPYDPACVRASMAALFGTRLIRAKPAQFHRWKARHGCLLVGTAPNAPLAYDAQPYPAPTVLWMGGERKGLSDVQMAQCDAMVNLPMRGQSDSLNLSVATGIMLYEVLRQRNGGLLTPALPPASASISPTPLPDPSSF